MEVLSGVCWPAVVDSVGEGNDGFVEVLALVMNSSPTSINSSRFDELLEVTSASSEDDFTGFTGGGVDTSTNNNTYSYNKTITIQGLLLLLHSNNNNNNNNNVYYYYRLVRRHSAMASEAPITNLLCQLPPLLTMTL